MPRTTKKSSTAQSTSSVVRSLLLDIRKQLEGSIDPAYADKIVELVPSRMEFLGVRVPVIRALVKSFVAAHPGLDTHLACDLYERCCESPCREELLFAQGILERFRRKLDPSIWPRLDCWIDSIDNWEVCDQLSANIAAPLITKKPALSRDLLKWAKSKNPWRRRFALATTTALNHGGLENVQLSLDVCDSLMTESVPIVQKAVGWALREAARKNPAMVEQFLLSHADRALPKTLRDARR